MIKEFQEGKILIDSPANKYLKKWKIPENTYTRTAPVTVRQLLSHTSGIARTVTPFYTINDPLPTVVQALSGISPAKNAAVNVSSVPGKSYSYSNWGYGILQQLLEDVENRELEDIVKQKVLSPLGMDHSSFDDYLPNKRFKSFASGHLKDNVLIDGNYYIYHPLASGSLWSTPSHLAKLWVDVQLSLKADSSKILKKEFAKIMTAPSPVSSGKYGLGFQLEKRGTGVKFFGHDGHNYGYISSVLGSLEGGFGVVIMTNSENGWKAVNKINKLVGRRFWGF